MELWAAGFNAWGQLRFSGYGYDEPNDMQLFAKVVCGAAIEPPDCRLSFALVRVDGMLRYGGLSEKRVLSSDEMEQEYRHMKTPSGLAFEPPVTIPSDSIKQVAAHETGFIVLCYDGSVYTSGDPRYPACLGRAPSANQSAEMFAESTSLKDLPGGQVVKVAAGGYLLAALTSEGDLYCWGGGPIRSALDDICELVNAVEPPDGKDVEDVAVGESHIILLARDGTVYVRGCNQNGQLGIGIDQIEGAGRRIDHWRQVELELTPGHRARAVTAGPSASFIITANCR